MGHDEILAVGHARLEPGEQFGWREPLMLFAADPFDGAATNRWAVSPDRSQ